MGVFSKERNITAALEGAPKTETGGHCTQRGGKPENLFLFAAPDNFIQFADQRILRLRALIACFEVVQESRDIPPLIGSYAQFDGIASAHEIQHILFLLVFCPEVLIQQKASVEKQKRFKSVELEDGFGGVNTTGGQKARPLRGDF